MGSVVVTMQYAPSSNWMVSSETVVASDDADAGAAVSRLDASIDRESAKQVSALKSFFIVIPPNR